MKAVPVMSCRVGRVHCNGTPIFLLSSLPIPIAVGFHAGQGGMCGTQVAIELERALGGKLGFPKRLGGVRTSIRAQRYVRFGERCVGFGIVAVSPDRISVVFDGFSDATQGPLIPEIPPAQVGLPCLLAYTTRLRSDKGTADSEGNFAGNVIRYLVLHSEQAHIALAVGLCPQMLVVLCIQ